jgi:DNA ligase (NAD+)
MKNWFGQPDNETEIERLMSLGFKFASKAATGPQPLAGKSFVITGALMSGQRDEVAEKIRKAGGTVKGSVSKKVNFVVQGVGGGRVKAEAAEKHGVPVITEEALYQMLGEAMPTANPRAHLEALRGD